MTVVVNFAINIADADVPRVQAATRAAYGSGLSDAEIVEKLRLEMVARLTTMVKSYEKRLAQAAADALDPVVGIA